MDSDPQQAERDDLREEQYRDSANLNARIRLHAQFSTNKEGWLRWVFRHMPMPDKARILELGCGPGSVWAHNREKIGSEWRAVLTDRSPGMVTEAAANLGDTAHFSFAVAGAEALSFKSSSFDVVIANHMLYHVSNRQAAFREIARVLAPGGRFYASTIGEQHMSELDQLVEQANGYPLLDDDISFTLENGAAQLSRVFSSVELIPYEDGLIVTEVEPLISYIKSGYDTGSAESLETLRRIILSEIGQHGAVRITKASGLFTARV